MRILVADDDTMFLKAVSDVLSGAGYSVTLATNGEQALNKAVTYVPDLIILDIVLPKMMGTEVCENLRMSKRTAGIPVILVTANVAETGAGSFPYYFKADDFLRKPFDNQELLAKVKLLAGKKSRFAEVESAKAPVKIT